jgi:hypothetical protein
MNDPKIDQIVDHILTIFKEQNALPIAYSSMDTIYRPFLQWLHSAQADRTNAAEVRQSMLNLISSMIIEAASRMGEVLPGGERVAKDVWIGELMLDLKQELIEDLNYHGKHH